MGGFFLYPVLDISALIKGLEKTCYFVAIAHYFRLETNNIQKRYNETSFRSFSFMPSFSNLLSHTPSSFPYTFRLSIVSLQPGIAVEFTLRSLNTAITTRLARTPQIHCILGALFLDLILSFMIQTKYHVICMCV